MKEDAVSAERGARLDPARIVATGLFGVLAAGAVASSLFIAEPDLTVAPTSDWEQTASFRLPRARPTEPVITGSVPVAVAAPNALTPDYIGQIVSGEGRIEALRNEAFLIASSSAGCDHVTSLELLENRDGHGDGSVFRVQCGNGARFYLDRDRIETNRPPASAPQQASLLSESEAVQACEAKLRMGLPVPSSFNRLSYSTGVRQGAAGNTVVTFDFDTLNGLGFPLVMHAQCELSHREIARLDVQTR